MSYPDQLVDKVDRTADKYCEEYQVITYGDSIILKYNLNTVEHEDTLKQELPTQDYPIEVQGWF